MGRKENLPADYHGHQNDTLKVWKIVITVTMSNVILLWQ